MRHKAQRVRLGIFIMISSALLLLIFGWFTGRKLFEQRDTYYVAYRDISVTGLEVGSPVKYLGINVGTIADISIDPADVNRIIFELRVEEGTPVKVDAVADIVAVGITGMKSIEIRGGTSEADFLNEGGFIEPGSTIAAEISGRAEVLTFKVEEVLNNLQVFTHPDNMASFTEAAERISLLVENSNNMVSRFDQMISENRHDIRETAKTINSISGTLDIAATDLASSMESFNTIMQGEEITEILGNLRDISLSVRESNVQELIANLAETTKFTQTLISKLEEDLEASSEHLNENLLLLQYTLENLNDATRKISTDPSILIRGQSLRGSPDRDLRGN